MGHFVLGFKALFRVWTDDAFASQVGRWLGNQPRSDEPAAPATVAAPILQAAPLPRQPRSPHGSAAAVSSAVLSASPAAARTALAAPALRNEALSLLAVLQRDSRLLDFLKEPLTGCSDAQVAAAARPVHKQASAVLDRIFGLEPLCLVAEGTPVEVPPGYDPSQYRLVGNLPATDGPLHGVLVHPGWKANRADVPAWNGRADGANVVAPVEVEL